MNVDRLVRDIVQRLEAFPENALTLVQEVVHEELAREQRYRTASSRWKANESDARKPRGCAKPSTRSTGASDSTRPRRRC